MADIKARILLRRGTAAEWTAANPVLLDGEPGWETDTGKFKIGDGVTEWGALPAYSLDQGIAAIEAKADAAAEKALNLSDLTDKPQALVNLGILATAEKLNALDGITATVDELNALDGILATTAQLNALASLPEIDGFVVSISDLLNEKYEAETQLASAWQAGTSTTESLVSPAKIKNAVEALAPDNGIGVGQTWQVVSRSSGVTYQNTTGKPIQVTFVCNTTGTVGVSVSENGVDFILLDSNNAASGTRSHTFAIIPADYYYRPQGIYQNYRELT